MAGCSTTVSCLAHSVKVAVRDAPAPPVKVMVGGVVLWLVLLKSS